MEDDRNKQITHLQSQNHKKRVEVAEEAEETLSLSGLLLNSDEVQFQDRSISSTSDPSEFFEFFNDLNSQNMCHAEDIIFCGKLIPYKENNPHSDNHQFCRNPRRNDKQKSFHRRRSESLSELKTTRSNSAKNQQFMRTSRSLNYQKFYKNQNSGTEKVEIERSSSTKSSSKGDDATGSKEKVPRSARWYMIFGLVKIPPEMAIQDIKKRQVRRNPGTLFTSLDAGGKAIVNRDDRSWSRSWDLLRVLSCKDHASVSVTASFGYLT